jgi:hypothetical protein
MKRLHDMEWFQTYFQNKQIDGLFYCYGTCNGMDYSFPSDSEGNARLLAETYLKKNGHLMDEEAMKKSNYIGNLEAEVKRNKEDYLKLNKETAMRHRSQLMSVYYMLDAISKTGTHREKQTVIMYQKTVLEGLINEGDRMPLSLSEFSDLPF